MLANSTYDHYYYYYYSSFRQLQMLDFLDNRVFSTIIVFLTFSLLSYLFFALQELRSARDKDPLSPGAAVCEKVPNQPKHTRGDDIEKSRRR